jgi:hypothetical protein
MHIECMNEFRYFFFLFTESDLFNVRVVDVLPPSLLSDIIDRDRISTNNNKRRVILQYLIKISYSLN